VSHWDSVHLSAQDGNQALLGSAAAFPGLTVVIETQWQKILYQIRNLFSLLRCCPKVLVEGSNLVGQDHVYPFGSEPTSTAGTWSA